MEALLLLWTPPSFAALFPATPGRECAGGECGHTGVAELTLRRNYRLARPSKSSCVWSPPELIWAGGGYAAVSIWQRGAVIDEPGFEPRRGSVDARRLDDRDDPKRRVAVGIEPDRARGASKT